MSVNVKGHDLEIENLVISVPQGVLFQDLGEETILLNVESGEYYGLNDVGSRIWSLMQNENPVRRVLQTLQDEYEVSEECLRADIQQFLKVLWSKGLVEVHDAGAE